MKDETTVKDETVVIVPCVRDGCGFTVEMSGAEYEVFLREGGSNLTCKVCAAAGRDRDDHRAKLLKDAATKPVRSVLQIDGDYSPDGADFVWRHNEDGYGVLSGKIFELRNTAIPVRVQIIEGTEQKVAVDLLEMILGYVKEGLQNLTGDAPLVVIDTTKATPESVWKAPVVRMTCGDCDAVFEEQPGTTVALYDGVRNIELCPSCRVKTGNKLADWTFPG